ncbi:hypothetical protein PDJAM_G00191000 [Pangasius djambal]|uniref:Uncharacterized protein n=1 Tax=Pangasius djambal TaxID=1691987 RepID=A0ACC5Y5N4_9TELE|nr:hypothetical protein [Pangasius djambal]
MVACVEWRVMETEAQIGAPASPFMTIFPSLSLGSSLRSSFLPHSHRQSWNTSSPTTLTASPSEPTTSTMNGSSTASGRASLLSASADTEKQSAARNAALASAPTTSARARPNVQLGDAGRRASLPAASPTHRDRMSDSMLKESDTSASEFPK